MIKALFFDAAGTLLYLTKTVGDHYAQVGEEIGLDLNAKALDQAFAAAWKAARPRPAIEGPREDDDKGWWRDLVEQVLAEAAPGLHELDRDNFFEIAYEHFAEASVWNIFPEVAESLATLHKKFVLAIVSNFDGRLRLILEHLGISRYFHHVFISSELGADKPDPLIFRRALRVAGFAASEVMHIGDDPERDWKAAEGAGLRVFRLQRPETSLRDLAALVCKSPDGLHPRRDWIKS